MPSLNNQISEKILAGGAMIAIIIVVLFGIDYYQKSAQTDGLSDSELLKASKEDIIDYTIQQDETSAGSEAAAQGIVFYHYVSNQEVPAANYQGLQEDLTKRTPNAQIFLKSAKRLDDRQVKKEYVGKFYSGDTFQKNGDKWFQIEIATTSKTAFERQTRLTLLDKAKEFIGRPVFAAVNISYPLAGDGYAYADNADHEYDWDYIHNRTSSDTATYTAAAAMWIETDGSSGEYGLSRVFLPFNTSAISSDANIVSANMSVMTILNYSPSTCANCNVNVVQTTQASASALALNDYDNCGAVHSATVGATAKVRADFVAETRTAFNLNSSGLGWIAKNGSASVCGAVSGVTCLGLRTGHDLADAVPTQLEGMMINLYPSEQTGTSKDPYLEITYIVPDLVSIDGGTINMDGGTMIID